MTQKAKKFGDNFDPHFKSAVKALRKHSDNLGWKSMYYLILKFQNAEWPESPYRLMSHDDRLKLEQEITELKARLSRKHKP